MGVSQSVVRSRCLFATYLDERLLFIGLGQGDAMWESWL